MKNEMDALLAILLLKPLLEYFWVFNNPVKILPWTLPSNGRTQRVLCSPVPACTLSQCPPSRVFSSTECSAVLGSSLMHLCTRSMPSWKSFSESSMILVFSELTAEFLPLCTPAHTLNAHLAEPYKTPHSFCLLQLSTEFFIQHLMLMLNAHLAELHRTYSQVLSAIVFQLHSLASKVFSNLEVFLLSC
jgi:hypothetical protein